MYAVSRYRLLRERPGPEDSRTPCVGAGASVGYITEVNVEIVARSNAPWWSSAAVSGTTQGTLRSTVRRRRGDHPRVQLEAGAKLHVRLYNAFLEGQFRHSDLAYSARELEPLLVDVWLGATTVFPNGFSVSYRSVTDRGDRIGPRCSRLRLGEHRDLAEFLKIAFRTAAGIAARKTWTRR